MIEAPAPPTSEQELMKRASAITGFTLEQLAARYGVAVPTSNTRSKGWGGQLVEHALGASAGSISGPDFPQLGVELKTIPISLSGKPAESTYVCTAPLLPSPEMQFESSCVSRKLARVLWFPVVSAPGDPIAQRRLGRPRLWSPSPDHWAVLRADFDEHIENIQFGRVGAITARHGQVLQIRPKGATAADRTPAVGPSGERIMTNPRGFYLRASFTARVIGAG